MEFGVRGVGESTSTKAPFTNTWNGSVGSSPSSSATYVRTFVSKKVTCTPTWNANTRCWWKINKPVFVNFRNLFTPLEILFLERNLLLLLCCLRWIVGLTEIFLAGVVRETCSKCGRTYKHKSSLYKHLKWECGVESQFKCSKCPYKGKQKISLITHMQVKHGEIIQRGVL